MRFRPGTRFVKFVVILGITMGPTCYLLWRKGQPKVQLATTLEMRNELPSNLLLQDKKDPTKSTRLDQLVEACNSLKRDELRRIYDLRLPEADRLALANVAFSPTRLGPFLLALESGPLQLYNPNPTDLHLDSLNDFQIFDYLRLLSRSLSEATHLFLKAGNSERATECLLIAIRFFNQVWKMEGINLVGYLNLTGSDSIISRTVRRYALDPNTKAVDCQRVLAEYSASPTVDTVFRDSIKREFLRITLPSLENPFANIKKIPLEPGDAEEYWQSDPTVDKLTYSSLDTARLLAKLLKVEIRNIGRPYKQRDWESRKMREVAERELPHPPGKEVSGFSRRIAWLKYIFFANQTPNYYGRLKASYALSDEQQEFISCRWRVFHDLGRIALASRIYRNAHNGALPSKRSDFGPILRPWPQDSFSGDPMIYDPRKQIAYSVGKDLVDDGGEIENIEGPAKDLGISLSIGART